VRAKSCGAIANIPNMIRRKRTNALYRQRNLVGRFFNELKQFRRIATRYDKLGADFRAFLKIAIVRISIRSIESKPYISRSFRSCLSPRTSCGTQLDRDRPKSCSIGRSHGRSR